MKKKITCTNYIIILEKKYFQANTPKIQMLMFRLQTSHFSLWDIIPSESQLAIHIHVYHVKYENALICKRISWDSGGYCFKNMFSISYMFNIKSDHFSQKNVAHSWK